MVESLVRGVSPSKGHRLHNTFDFVLIKLRPFSTPLPSHSRIQHWPNVYNLISQFQKEGKQSDKPVRVLNPSLSSSVSFWRKSSVIRRLTRLFYIFISMSRGVFPICRALATTLQHLVDNTEPVLNVNRYTCQCDIHMWVIILFDI